MLITNFMRQNPNWEELLSNPPYSLKIRRKDNLILFNYSQIESDPSNEIVKEARGAIIEEGTFKPICVGFKRFYNIDESYAAKIDWNTAVATSKEDGTLFFIYWYNNKWHIKTRSTFDAEEASMGNVKFTNFKELFDYLVSFYPNFSYDKLNKNYVYCLEGCSDFNRIVIKYNKPCLFHLMTRDMSTLQEIDVEIGIPKPKKYKLNNEKDYREFVKNMGDNNEGIVVCDGNFNRVKIKTKKYIELHRMANNGILTTERALSIFLENEMSEFLTYFPQYKDFIYDVIDKYDVACREIIGVNIVVEEWKRKNPSATRKDFSDWVKEHFNSYTKWAYLAYDGRLSIEGKTAKELVKFLGLD